MSNQTTTSIHLTDGKFIRFAYEGNQYACLVLRDDSPDNPLHEDGHLGEMLCWNRKYSLGHFNPYETPEDSLRELAMQYVPMSLIRQRITMRKTDLWIRHTKDEVLLMGFWCGKDGEILSEPTEDDIFSEGNKEEIVNSIEEGLFELIQESPEIVILPLYLLDHSGLSISTDDFHAPYDSGLVGWIYADQEMVKEQLGTDVTNQIDWKEQASIVLKQEVEQYSQYISNDVYGYTLYALNSDTNEWEKTENSCWGFFGLDIMESGLADSVPGLNEAIQSGEYSVGTAKKQIITTWKF